MIRKALTMDKSDADIVVAKAISGGHSVECPKCKVLTLVVGPPVVVKCVCGNTYFATWYRAGDSVINTDQKS